MEQQLTIVTQLASAAPTLLAAARVAASVRFSAMRCWLAAGDNAQHRTPGAHRMLQHQCALLLNCVPRLFEDKDTGEVVLELSSVCRMCAMENPA